MRKNCLDQFALRFRIAPRDWRPEPLRIACLPHHPRSICTFLVEHIDSSRWPDLRCRGLLDRKRESLKLAAGATGALFPFVDRARKFAAHW